MKIDSKYSLIILLTFLLTITIYTASFAADIDSIQARDYAESFFIKKGWGSSKNNKDSLYIISKPLFYDSANNVKDYAFYIFQLNNKGYVAISAWNFSRRILFYAKGDFITNSKVEAFQYWINSYIQMILDKYKGKGESSKGTANTITHYRTLVDTFPPYIEPMISTTWNQGCYYNELCPEDPAGPCDHVVAGCVAIAMAQIINYHQYPENGVGSNTYELPAYGEQYADFSEGYNYSLYPLSLSSSNPDLARFIYHCGVAVNMDYSPSGSGAFSSVAAYALIKYFRYSKALSYLYSEDYNTDVWISMIKEDLKNGKPIYYDGYDDAGRGHAFVCDGYDEDGLFHFNLGWGGYANGYYSLEDLTFNNDQGAIFKIKPIYKGPANPQDSLALVALYNATDGANWTHNENWLTGNCVDWYGIELDEKGVLFISLSNNNLSGFIPNELGTIININKMDLSGNHLDGNIPTEIGSLVNLHELNLSGNLLSGNIPTEIGNLINLQKIDLSANRLSGNIPPDLGNLDNLKYLYLNNNQLSGDIPTEIGNLISLQKIDLSANHLSGNIPPDLGNLIHLWKLDLSFNRLSGNIPPDLGNLVHLWNLDLRFNQLSGNIPADLGNLIHLLYLDLSFNQLSGTIPPDLGNLVHLWNLDLSFNKLSEIPNLPDSLCYRFYVNWNQLTFEDIEPNIHVAKKEFRYSPQAKVGEPMDTTLHTGDLYQLKVSVGGVHNRYQWFLNGKAITGATDSILTIHSFAANNTGEYKCKVTNTVATALTLESAPIHLHLQLRVTFHIVDSSGVNIENARIILNKDTLYTGTDGQANIALPPGKYSYQLYKKDYYPFTTSLVITDSDTTLTDTLTLIKYDVSFVITDGEDPLENARVILGEDTLLTGANGIASFLVVPGKYGYSVTLGGYDPVNDSVTVSDKDISLTLALTLTKHNITFIISDGTNPVQNAQVVFGEDTLQTLADGTASFSVVPDKYGYSVTLKGYDSVTDSLVVTDKDTTLNISLSPTKYEVILGVTDGQNSLAGAQVIFAGDTLITNDSGSVVFNVITGQYSYIAGKEGYDTLSGELTVAADTTLTLILTASTGIPDLPQAGIKVYPNPSSGRFVIEASEPFSDTQLRLMDLKGNTILVKTLHGEKRVRLNLAGRAKGIYILQIQVKEQLYHCRIVIQ